jgi:hypothetical protein
LQRQQKQPGELCVLSLWLLLLFVVMAGSVCLWVFRSMRAMVERITSYIDGGMKACGVQMF